MELGDGGKPCFFRLFPAAVEQEALGDAQLVTDFAIAGSLAGLTCQLLKLVGELFDYIIDAGEVLLGAFQLQFCLVTALV